jgi:sarcosine oxidase
MRVAVIGAGIVGAAAGWALTHDGHDVTIYEQFDDVEHPHGSSHGRTRIVRMAYTEAHWVEQAREALALWRELERETGETLLELDGLIECVRSHDLGAGAALDAAGVDWQLVEPERYGVSVPDGWEALLQPEAGTVRADRARRAFLRGLDVRAGVRVERASELDADAVVVAAGPWSPALLRADGIELPVRTTRETVLYFEHELTVSAVVDRYEGGHLMYALRDPVHGTKAGAHMAGVEADPDERGDADTAAVERVSRWVEERLRADPRPVATDTCWYTTTADEEFVLERNGRLVIASACSGHGFKFAPLVGRRIAAIL